jgi:prepilin-type N-terminal cleavage/methylation domain-containing protein
MASAMNHARSLLRQAGFSLIELIGVMAIIAILAAIAAPMTVRSIDRLAVKAEVATLNRLAEYTKLHLQRTGVLPTAASWRTDLVGYTDFSASALEFNSRNVARVYLVEPVGAGVQSTRVLILSSMREGLTLPAAVNATAFNEIWNTVDGERPATWTSWPAHHGEFLVITRVNLAADLRSYTFQLQNPSGGAVRYVVVGPSGSSVVGSVSAGQILPVPIRTGWRLDLYNDNVGTTLRYSYVVNDHPRTFVFDGTTTTWTAP